MPVWIPQADGADKDEIQICDGLTIGMWGRVIPSLGIACNEYVSPLMRGWGEYPSLYWEQTPFGHDGNRYLASYICADTTVTQKRFEDGTCPYFQRCHDYFGGPLLELNDE